MDIRELTTLKPRLAQLVEIRFSVFHNLRQLDQLEPAVADHIKAHGKTTVATKGALFELSLDPDETRVNADLKETKSSEGLNYLSMPEPIQLFCNALKTLHRNQQGFWGHSPDEIQQIQLEFLDVAQENHLLVNKGEFQLRVKLADGKLFLDMI